MADKNKLIKLLSEIPDGKQLTVTEMATILGKEYILLATKHFDTFKISVDKETGDSLISLF